MLGAGATDKEMTSFNSITKSNQTLDLVCMRSLLAGSDSLARHLRSVRSQALRKVIKQARGEPDRKSPDYVSQREIAGYLRHKQPTIANIENGVRRCDVLEFIDLGDALYEDRMALFSELIRLSPRRFKPIRTTKEWREHAGKRARGRKPSTRIRPPKT